MTAAPVRLLLLEDDRDDAELLRAALAKFAPGGFAITHVERLADALARIRTGQFDVLLSDLGLPDSSGLETVQAIAARAPALPLVVLTGFQDDELGRAAIEHGAQDFLVKGETSGALMGRTLRYAIERKHLEIGLRAANEALAGRVAERTAELEAANAMLFANAAGYRQLFDANPHPMYMCDPETLRFIAVNDAAVAHYGWSREEFLAMTLADTRPAGEIQRLRDHIARVQREDIRDAGVWKHRKKDGTLIDVEISSHAIEFGGRRVRVVLAHDITERRRAEDALRESEGRFRSLTEMSSDWYWEQDRELRLSFHSSGFAQRSGTTSDKLLGKFRWEEPNRVPLSCTWDEHRAMLEAHEPFRNFEYVRIGDDGEQYFVSLSGVPIYDAAGKFNGYRGVGTNITERKQNALALARQKDLYNALSQTNQAIVRGAGREELFHAICRIAVEHGHFRFAWIGLIERNDKRVKPVAQYGEDAGYVQQLDISIDETVPAGRGRTGQALRTGSRAVSNDLGDEGANAPSLYRDAARRSGARAYGAFPIRQGGVVTGVINFYAGETGFFTEDLIATLEEMALDVSFALDNLEREAERKRVQQALSESEARYRSVFARSNVTMLLIDPADGRIVDANSAACAYYGWDLPLLQAMNIKDINTLSPEQVQADLDRIRDKQRIYLEFRHRLANGEVRDVEIFSGPVEVGGRKLLLSVIHDVTERTRAKRELTESEDRFRGLVEQSIAGIYIIQDGKFAYVNPRFAEIRGYGSANELIGRAPESLVAEQDRGALAAYHRELLAGEAKPMTINFTGLCKDGSTVEIGAHGIRATYQGRPAIIGLMQDISEKKRAEEQIQRYVAQLETAFMSTVDVATTLSEMRDPYTAGHERRVADIAVAIGAELGIDARRQEGLRVAGHLHDIGKITVPTEILAKPGNLTAIEYQLIKVHAQASYDVLKDVKFPFWPVAQVALQHHERMDGSGYPQGLKAEEILLEARIMAVADVIEAMSSHRPYRPGLGIEKALAEIEHGRGTRYDAAVADACLRLFREKRYQLPS